MSAVRTTTTEGAALRDYHHLLDRAALPDAVRVGTDVQQVDAVEESLRRLGARYVDYVFTPHEAVCAGWPEASPREAAPGFAARFAVKEATVKVLRPTGPRLPWREIEVRRHEGGWCSLELHGSVGVLASELGLGSWAIAFSHDGGVAVATVVAITGALDLVTPLSSCHERPEMGNDGGRTDSQGPA